MATAATPHVVEPNGGRRLSEGVLVATSIVARLLGIKLLTVEGTIVLSPTQLRQAGASAGRPFTLPPIARRAPTNGIPHLTDTDDPDGSHAIGVRLGTAERLLSRCSETLRRVDMPGL